MNAGDLEAGIEAALGCWRELAGGSAKPLGRGLINHTYRVDTADGRYVLQRVSPIFDPAIHHNIEAVTARLAAMGMETPRLVAAKDGAPLPHATGAAGA